MPGSTDNPYVALREAKIARNEARLAQLGLLRPSTITANSKRNSQNLKSNTHPVAPKPLLEPTRRSNRLSQQANSPDYKEVPLPTGGSRKRTLIANSTGTNESSHSSTPKLTQQKAPAANSVRSIDIDVSKLVLGENGLLGRMVEQFGKDYVINKSFQVASTLQDQQRLSGTRLSFNKYCGIQEWGNAVFLWVNLGSKDNTVVNDFLDDGKKITWFGGSKMYDDSPVIQKLLKLGKDATKSESNIVLWIRRYDAKSKKFTPYICMGRLSYDSHMPGSHPLAFVCNLIDADLLKNHPDVLVKEEYQTLIQL